MPTIERIVQIEITHHVSFQGVDDMEEKIIPDRNIENLHIPSYAFYFYMFDTAIMKFSYGGKELELPCEKSFNFSPRYFVRGEPVTKEEAIKKYPEEVDGDDLDYFFGKDIEEKHVRMAPGVWTLFMDGKDILLENAR